jgi:hypothetical protein
MTGDLLMASGPDRARVFVQPGGIGLLDRPGAGNTTASPDDKPKKIWDILKPGQADMKGLRTALEFLKLTPDDLENYFNAIGSLVNLAGGIVSVVGAVTTIKDLLTKLKILESTEFNTQAALEQIGLRLEQVYAHLANADRKGLSRRANGAPTSPRRGVRSPRLSIQGHRSP